jgi:hypothetical protein
MDTYIKALNIPDDPDQEVTLRESPLEVMSRRLKSKNIQTTIVQLFRGSIFEPRLRIIEDTIWSHNKSKYTLSVPVLIIQIEGILHDLAYYLKWEFEKKEMYKSESAKAWAIIKRLGDKPFENTLIRFYSRKPSSGESPRNLILHGRSIDYGKDHKLSTVLFLILIYLVTFFEIEDGVATN